MRGCAYGALYRFRRSARPRTGAALLFRNQGARFGSDFHDHGHNHGAAAGGFLDQALQFHAYLFLDHAVVAFFFAGQAIERLENEFARLVGDFGAAKAADDDFRRLLHLAGSLIDGQHGEDKTVFAQNAPVADDEFFDDVDGRAGVDEDATCGDLVFLACIGVVELEHVSIFDHDGVFDGAGLHGDLGVAMEIAIIAVDGNEVLGPDQVDEEAHFFLAAVTAHVDEACGAVIGDDVGIAAVEVVDDAEDAFFVAGNDARTENDRVAAFDAGVLVVVDGGAAERAHGLALSSADEQHELFGRKIAKLAGIDDEARRRVDIAKILRDLSALDHGAADDGHLAAMLAGEVERNADAVDGRREAAEEDFLFCVGEDFVEAGNDGAFAGRIAGTLHVGGVLQQGQHAALAVLSEGMQVEGLFVERREIDLEIAGMDHDADRRLNREGNAVDQRMGDADRLDGERADGELFARRDLDELGFVEQLVFFEASFDVGEGEFGGVNGNLELAQQPWEAADVVLVAVSKDDGPHMGFIFNEVRDVGNYDVDAQQF